MMIQRLLCTSVLGLALTSGACDSGDTKADGKAAKADASTPADAKKTADAKAADDGAKAADDGAKAADDGAKAADDGVDERVVKAASLAAKIEADPTKADQILEDAGMDRAAFDALIYEVSEPGLAEQYRLARADNEG